MNPMSNVKGIERMNKRELDLGLSGTSTSWHAKYKDSAWIFIGGLPYDLTEGDIICVFSQYGEIVNINLVRDKKTGKSLGYGFICYEDTRSPILAVDNLNGIKLLNRTIRVDHVENYRAPKEDETETSELKELRQDGCAPKLIVKQESAEDDEKPIKIKEKKKIKKEKKAKKKKRKSSISSSSSESEAEGRGSSKRHRSVSPPGGDRIKIKTEKRDSSYETNRRVKEERSSRDRDSRREHSSSSRGRRDSPERSRSKYDDKYHRNYDRDHRR